MKIRTSELIGPALDWLVAKCNGDFALYHDIEDASASFCFWRNEMFKGEANASR